METHPHNELTVCITSTIRPVLLSLTLRSFRIGLFAQYSRIRLIANLDPLHVISDSDRAICIALLNQYAKGSAPIIYQPALPDFNKAVRNLWSAAVDTAGESDYFLHLEDDWFLSQRVSRGAVEEVIRKPDTASVRLYLKGGNSSPPETGFSLNPSFVSTTTARNALEKWVRGVDPEKMLGQMNLGKTVVFRPASALLPCVIDTGTYWRKSRNIQKTYDLIGSQAVSRWQLGPSGTQSSKLKELKYKAWFSSMLFALTLWQAFREFKQKLQAL